LDPIINWGIIAPGRISSSFAKALNSTENANIRAVYGRNRDKACDFAENFNVEESYDDINAFLDDEKIQVVYVATPHPMHKFFVKKCLEAKKAVLCEKPMTINEKDTRELVEVAKENKAFLMEAMWSRFTPAMTQVKNWIKNEEIGELKMLEGSFGFQSSRDPKSRLYDLELAGGALLDVGIYPISVGTYLLEEFPIDISSQLCIGPTGVDEFGSAVMKYANDKLLSVSFGINCQTKQNFIIYGSKGFIEISAPFYAATKATLNKNGSDPLVFEKPFNCNGYEYEVLAVMDCLNKKLLEHPLCKHLDSIAIASIMDKIRSENGLVYPGE
jgi:predicted dehydrogenase